MGTFLTRAAGTSSAVLLYHPQHPQLGGRKYCGVLSVHQMTGSVRRGIVNVKIAMVRCAFSCLALGFSHGFGPVHRGIMMPRDQDLTAGPQPTLCTCLYDITSRENGLFLKVCCAGMCPFFAGYIKMIRSAQSVGSGFLSLVRYSPNSVPLCGLPNLSEQGSVLL